MHVDAWRKILRDVDDALNLWGTTYRLRLKTTGLDQQPDDEDLDDDEAPESGENESDEDVA